MGSDVSLHTQELHANNGFAPPAALDGNIIAGPPDTLALLLDLFSDAENSFVPSDCVCMEAAIKIKQAIKEYRTLCEWQSSGRSEDNPVSWRQFLAREFFRLESSEKAMLASLDEVTAMIVGREVPTDETESCAEKLRHRVVPSLWDKTPAGFWSDGGKALGNFCCELQCRGRFIRQMFVRQGIAMVWFGAFGVPADILATVKRIAVEDVTERADSVIAVEEELRSGTQEGQPSTSDAVDDCFVAPFWVPRAYPCPLRSLPLVVTGIGPVCRTPVLHLTVISKNPIKDICWLPVRRHVGHNGRLLGMVVAASPSSDCWWAAPGVELCCHHPDDHAVEESEVIFHPEEDAEGEFPGPTLAAQNENPAHGWRISIK